MTSTLTAILRSIRLPNLLIIALTQSLAWLFIVEPAYALFRLPLAFGLLQLVLFALASVLIAAGGYLMNDYFDIEPDKINKPGKNLVELAIAKPVAWRWALGLFGAGLLVGLIMALSYGRPMDALGFVVPVALLMWYNRSLKGIMVAGNLLIAFLAAYVLLLLAIIVTKNLNWADVVQASVGKYIWKGVGAYALFAFLMTWVRELVKDIQDMQGDKLSGARTLPIKIGERGAKFIAIILLLLVLRSVLSLQQWYLAEQEMVLPLILLLGVQLPALVAVFLVWKANTPKRYGHVSLLLKLMMLAGILSLMKYDILIWAS